MTATPLPKAFYQQSDVVALARQFLGKRIVTNIEGLVTAGLIIETEAYCHKNDKACHAYKKMTPRNRAMFGDGGHLYTYLCYGIHTLVNIVTNVEGKADAVLVRAILPTMGMDTMQQRRGKSTLKDLVNGPGKVSQALGLTRAHNTVELQGDIRIEDVGIALQYSDYQCLKRVGIDYAEEDADLPWRFLANTDWCERLDPERLV